MKKITITITFLLLISCLFSGCSNIKLSAETTTPEPKVTGTPLQDTENAKPSASLEYTTFESVGFELNIPNSWMIEDSASGGVVFRSPDSHSYVEVVSEFVGDMSVKEYYETVKGQITAGFDSVDYREHGIITVGEYDGYMATFMVDLEDETFLITQYYLACDNEVYTIAFVRLPSTQGLQDDVDFIVNSFRFTKSASNGTDMPSTPEPKVSPSYATCNFDGFTIDVPDTWIVDETRDFTVIVAPDTQSGLNFVREFVDMSAKEYFSYAQDGIYANFENVKYLTGSAFVIDGLDSYTTTFTAELEGETLVFSQFYIPLNGEMIVFTFTRFPDNDSADLQTDVLNMINSFRATASSTQSSEIERAGSQISESGSYSIDIPAGWEIEYGNALDFISNRESFASLSISHDAAYPKELTTEAYAREIIAILPQVYDDCRNIVEGFAGFGGFYKCSFTYGTGDLTQDVTQYYLVSGGIAYKIAFRADPIVDYQQDVDAMLRTFKAN